MTKLETIDLAISAQEILIKYGPTVKPHTNGVKTWQRDLEVTKDFFDITLPNRIILGRNGINSRQRIEQIAKSTFTMVFKGIPKEERQADISEYLIIRQKNLLQSKLRSSLAKEGPLYDIAHLVSQGMDYEDLAKRFSYDAMSKARKALGEIVPFYGAKPKEIFDSLSRNPNDEKIKFLLAQIDDNALDYQRRHNLSLVTPLSGFLESLELIIDLKIIPRIGKILKQRGIPLGVVEYTSTKKNHVGRIWVISSWHHQKVRDLAANDPEILPLVRNYHTHN